MLDWTAFGENAVSLSEAIAVAMRFGHLLDFPEQPHKGRAQADDDAQKQQRQARGCEHVDHPRSNANQLTQTKQCKRRTSARHQRNGLGAKYTKAASIISGVPLLNFI